MAVVLTLWTNVHCLTSATTDAIGGLALDDNSVLARSGLLEYKLFVPYDTLPAFLRSIY